MTYVQIAKKEEGEGRKEAELNLRPKWRCRFVLAGHHNIGWACVPPFQNRFCLQLD